MALQDLTPQLRTRLGRVERLVGLFLLMTLVLLLVAVAYYIRHTAKQRGWFTVKVPYYTMVGDATGLRVGSPVTMVGFNVGEITKIEPTDWSSEWNQQNGYNVFVGLTIRHPYHGYILTDSRVKLGAGDFLGARSLEILAGRTGMVTVVVKEGQPVRVLKDDYFWKPAENFDYLTVKQAPKGYFLAALEEKPLPVRLTEIANQVNEALPGVFAMTNQVNVALGNLTNITAQLAGVMPKVDGAIADARALMGDLRPALQKPGGLGELVLPTNLNTQITLLVSNLNPGSGPLANTLSNVNQRLTDVGLTLTNVNQQLSRNTNLLADANQLTRDVGSLATSIETLLRKHWLFRSAFKTNAAKKK